jgi:transaldolase
LKIFLDSANPDEIIKAKELGIVEGVTTNPTLIAKEGRDFHGVIKQLCEIVKGPVNAEVIGLDADDMIREAQKLSALGENVVIKIPMTAEGLKAVHVLSGQNIKTNVTLVFSANQALLAAKAGAAFVSPFMGRMDDIGSSGQEMLKDIVEVVNTANTGTQVIAASIRHPMHVIQAAKAGAHIATIPYKVIEAMLKHPLTDIGIQKFLSDWNKMEVK